jgi:hypothetical protein
VVTTFPELDFFIHGSIDGGGSISTSSFNVLATLSTADIMIASSGGLSRFAAVLNKHGLVLAPESAGYPLHAHTVYGKKVNAKSEQATTGELVVVGGGGGSNDLSSKKSSGLSATALSEINQENNIFFRLMPKFPRLLLVDATNLFNIGSGFISLPNNNNNRNSNNKQEDSSNDGASYVSSGGSNANVGKLKGLQAAIYGAKRSRLGYEGGLWIEENVYENALELRIDPLTSASVATTATPKEASVQQTKLSVTFSRDQCLKFASQNSPKGKVCSESVWWKCNS